LQKQPRNIRLQVVGYLLLIRRFRLVCVFSPFYLVNYELLTFQFACKWAIHPEPNKIKYFQHEVPLLCVDSTATDDNSYSQHVSWAIWLLSGKDLLQFFLHCLDVKLRLEWIFPVVYGNFQIISLPCRWTVTAPICHVAELGDDDVTQTRLHQQFLFFFFNFGDGNWRQTAAWLTIFGRDGWGERSCPRSTTAIHSVAVDRSLNFPIERRTLYHWVSGLLPPQTTILEKRLS